MQSINDGSASHCECQSRLMHFRLPNGWMDVCTFLIAYSSTTYILSAEPDMHNLHKKRSSLIKLLIGQSVGSELLRPQMDEHCLTAAYLAVAADGGIRLA